MNLFNWKSENKLIYKFVEAGSNDRVLIGKKAISLCEMSKLGMNVPHGFVITW